MKELKKLFSPRNSNPSSIVKIIAKHTDTAFVVQDIRQKRFIAESDGSYRIGQTVVVTNGIITGKTKSLSSFNEYTV